MWTGCKDNITCGKQKTPYLYFLVESSVDEAIEYIEKVFWYNPYGASCECCGDDFTIRTSLTKHEALGLSAHEFDTFLLNGQIRIISSETVKQKKSLIS